MREQIDGHSLDAQETHIRQYAAAQDWTFVQLYTDASLSAKKDSERPELQHLLDDAAAGQFDVIVVDKIDRFFRHLGGLLVALEQLNARGISFASVQERLDFTTSWGKLTLTVLGMLAEIYIDNLRQETRKGKHQRARKGLWNGSIPFGYCRGLCAQCQDPNGAGYCPEFGTANKTDGKVLIAHPIDSLAVKLAYEWYATGDYSDASVADTLQAYEHRLPNGEVIHFRKRGVPHFTPPGPINKDGVRELLQKVLYTGQVPYYGNRPDGRKHDRSSAPELYPGQHPALIEMDTFQRVQEVRALLSRKQHEKQGHAAYIFPLTGVLRCGYCGAHFRGVSVRGVRYYRDSAQIEHLRKCSQPLIRANVIEQAVVEWLLNRLELAVKTYDPQVAQLCLQEAEARLERAQILYLAGEISRDHYEAEKSRLVIFEKSLTFSLGSDILALSGSCIQQLQHWMHTLPIEQKRLIRLVLESAFLRGDAVVGYQPTPACLPLLGNENVVATDPTGFEPAISALTGPHVRPLHHGSNTYSRAPDNTRPTRFCQSPLQFFTAARNANKV